MIKTIVYYDVSYDPDVNMHLIAVTDKPFFDKYGYMDDGAGDNYESLNLAMTACGTFESAESVYELTDPDVSKLIDKMREYGFELIQNSRFSALFQSNNT